MVLLVRPEESEVVDPRFFAPFGNIGFFGPVSRTALQTGSKLGGITGFFDDIAKFFSKGGATPTTKALGVVSRGGVQGARDSRSAVSTVAEIITSKPTQGLIQTTTKGGNVFFKVGSGSGVLPKVPKLFSSTPISKNLLIGTTGAGVVGVTTGALLFTEEGQEFTEGIGNFGEQFVKFVADNPLIVAGVVGLGVLVALK